MSGTTEYERGTMSKDRTKDYPGEFPFTGVISDNPDDQTAFLAAVNKNLADLQLGLASDGILPGTTGPSDGGYAIPSPGFGLAGMSGISVYKQG